MLCDLLVSLAMHRLLLNALRLLCLSCPGLVSVGACCCGAVLLPRASWSFRAPPLCTNLFWTLRCRLERFSPSLLVLGQTIAPLRNSADRTKHVQRRVQSLLANIPIARPCGRSCAPPSPFRRRLVRHSFIPSQRGSDLFLTSPSLRLLQAPAFSRGVVTASVSCALRLAHAAQTFCHL